MHPCARSMKIQCAPLGVGSNWRLFNQLKCLSKTILAIHVKIVGLLQVRAPPPLPMWAMHVEISLSLYRYWDACFATTFQNEQKCASPH